MGDGLATKTNPVKLVRKTLYILVEDAAYSQHLQYYTDRLMELMAAPAILGEGKVLKIRFRVGTLEKEPEIRKELKKPPVPLKNEELEMVTQVSDQIRDKDLRDVFSSYMKKIRTREKNAPEQ